MEHLNFPIGRLASRRASQSEAHFRPVVEAWHRGNHHGKQRLSVPCFQVPHQTVLSLLSSPNNNREPLERTARTKLRVTTRPLVYFRVASRYCHKNCIAQPGCADREPMTGDVGKNDNKDRRARVSFKASVCETSVGLKLKTNNASVCISASPGPSQILPEIQI